MTRQIFPILTQLILLVLQLFLTNLTAADSLSTGETGTEEDIQILNCALYIEHLESALYSEGLSRFSVQNFVDAGLEPWMYGRLQEILEHEETHVNYLRTAVANAGGHPIGRCAYNFPYDDPMSFVELASKFETIGTAAYHGASAMLTDEQYVSASGAILGIEARHSGWIDSSVRKVSAWSGAFGVPLNCGQMLTLVSPYIESCPSKDLEISPLPKPYPPLTISNLSRPNELASLSFSIPKNSTSSSSLSAIFLTSNAGVLTVPVDLQDEQKPIQVRIPEKVRGDAFVIIVNNAKDVLDESIFAGPALMRLDFDSADRLE
ncbi:ferritin-like domain-containing protein [Lentinula guzmanii]|uniref:Ferritin-like domain-containing protein n=1 Tax=Lentinula guzmanii TaxID=2804957 RepID=A0AA38JIP7_9AGAR|nr:ferritin-like domain-containing protein [Lentinula guzmanii]